MFVEPQPKRSAVTQQFGIWFLNAGPSPYTVLSRPGTLGELYFAPVVLPENAPAGKPGPTPAVSVANEMASALRWLSAQPGNPAPFRSLAEDFRLWRRPIPFPVTGSSSWKNRRGCARSEFPA